MLPFSYDEDKLVLLPVDPNTLFAFWDFSTETWNRIAGNSPKNLVLVLQCDSDERHFGVDRHTKSFYFKGLRSNNRYKLSFGYFENGQLITLMTAKPMMTPADRPSQNRHYEVVRFQFVKPPEVLKMNQEWTPAIQGFSERAKLQNESEGELLDFSGSVFSENPILNISSSEHTRKEPENA